MKQRARAQQTPGGMRYDWPGQGDIDCDYATGRELTGEWRPLPSRIETTRGNHPIAGGPLYCVGQLDTALVPQEDHASAK